ncbi:MAG: histidinol-phosphatase [Firmicutes bacterium HGW-Firmicutes-12]|jgi:putative hydrolase|nr:MAG: histidinol-phosphatase [Firmicutes bacterium HGW-Firmicutes-12]
MGDILVKFFGDYHMHTTYSDGRGTVEEMVVAAAQSGLAEMGIADHGPANIGTGVKNEKVFIQIKEELRALQSNNPGIRTYIGVESNILNTKGDLDVSREIIEQLDYLLVGLHPYIRPRRINEAGWIINNQAVWLFPPLKSKVINNNTKALTEAIYKYDVRAITHPGLKMPIDIPEVAKACLKCDTAWEINAGHRFPDYHEVIEAARCGVDFIVNSDAHFPKTVGRLDYGGSVLEKAGIPSERVKNAIDCEE